MTFEEGDRVIDIETGKLGTVVLIDLHGQKFIAIRPDSENGEQLGYYLNISNFEKYTEEK